MTPRAELRERARAKLTVGEYGALRAELARELRAEIAAAGKVERTPRYRETSELAGAARRMMRAVADRAASDVDALPLLAGLRDDLDVEIRRAVDGARDATRHAHPYSWTDVGRVLGITRQAAQQRFAGGRS